MIKFRLDIRKVWMYTCCGGEAVLLCVCHIRRMVWILYELLFWAESSCPVKYPVHVCARKGVLCMIVISDHAISRI